MFGFVHFNFRIETAIVNKVEYTLIKIYQSQYLKIINDRHKKMAAILLQWCLNLIWEKRGFLHMPQPSNVVCINITNVR